MDHAPGRVDPSHLRTLGHRAVDWIADYLERVETLPVQSRAEPGDLLRALPERPPQHGLADTGWQEVFDDLDRHIVPGLTHWQSPSFFAYFPCNGSVPAILGELLSAGLGIQGMLWATSPAATELEIRVLEWLADMLELPAALRRAPGGGCIQGTASESTLVAMIAARHRVLAASGASADRLVAYTSTEAHSSVVKAAMIAGLCRNASGGGALRRVAVDGRCAMDPRALAAAVQRDRDAGKLPFFVSATAGTTSSGAFDPLPELATVLRAQHFAETGGWLHVDAAWAGSACICPEHRPLLDGVEHATSLCFNPHKWLLTSFDCSCLWAADVKGLTASLSVTPEYLRNRATESGAVTDFRDWQIPLGRRFRALKLWLVVRHFGVEGLRAHIRHHVALAEELEQWVASEPVFELCAPRSLALVCFRLRGDGEEADRRNRLLLERANASGRVYLTHTALPQPMPDGPRRIVLRMAIGATATCREHVVAAWQLLRELAREV